MPGRTAKSIQGAYTSLFHLSVALLIQIFLAPFVLKMAGEDVFGAYVILMQMVNYTLIMDFGLGATLSRYLAQNFERDSSKFIGVFNSGRYLIILINVLMSILLLFMALYIDVFVATKDKWIINEMRNGLYLFSMWIMFRIPFALYKHALFASQNMAAANIIGILGNVIRFLLSIYFVFMGYSLIGLVVANIASEFFNLFAQRLYFKKLYPKVDLNWRLPNLPLLKDIVSFGMVYWFINIATLLTVGSDSIVIGYLYGTAAVAIFYLTKTPALLLIDIIYKITDNINSAFSELYGQKKYDVLRSAYLKVLRYSLLLAIPASIGTIIFNELVVTIWVGREQFAGSVMSVALSSLIITHAVSHLNAAVIVAFGDIKKWAVITVIFGVISIVLFYIFGLVFNMQWAMVATALVDIPVFVFLLNKAMFLLNTTFVHVYQKSIRPSILSSLPLAGFFLIDRASLNLDNFYYYMIAFLFVFVVSTYKLGLNKGEREVVRGKILR